MDFLKRAKDKLLIQTQNDISKIEGKIEEVERKLSDKNEVVSGLSQKKENEVKSKSPFEKNVLKGNEIEDLKILYEFIANFQRIKMIADKISKMTSLYDDEVFDLYDEIPTEISEFDESSRRNKFTENLKSLNDEIIAILDEESEEFSEKEDTKEENNHDDKTSKKTGFFAKLFGKTKKNNNQSNLINENNEQKGRMFEYKATIEKFKRYYDRFMVLDEERNSVMDIKYCTREYSNITYLLGLKRKGIQLDRDDEQYLDSMKPLELWEEAMRYYANMEIIKSIIKSFDARYEKFQLLYSTNPELFETDTLKSILEENNLTVVNLKSRRKKIAGIDSELTNERAKTTEIKKQIRELNKSKEELIEKKKKIESAKTLQELGYKNKSDAAKKLGINLKEYIVIPVLRNISNIAELFNSEKQSKVEADERTFNIKYSNDVAYGKINSVQKGDDVDLVLLIPIANLSKEDIDSIKSGKIGLYSSVMNLDSIIALKSSAREFDFQNKNVELSRVDDIYKSVKRFLGDDFTEDYLKEITNYDIFRNIPNVSMKEKKLKREAVKEGLYENISKDISQDLKIMVDGKLFFLNNNDIKDIKYLNNNKDLDEEKIKIIAERIEEFLIEGSNSSFKIDGYYNDLFNEYMRINKKARAEYIEEENTIVSIKDKNYSIKPVLPAKREKIIRRYSRRNEDIVFKMMKLANLVNRFAHLTENEELQRNLYQVKLDLIEEVIDLSEKNPNIKVKQKFDENKMVRSVILEIPGYNMIALHILNTKNTLMRKANSLEYNDDTVVQSSTIQYPGVNKDFLLALKKMNSVERKERLLQLDDKSFYKLMIRMGYNSDTINSMKERKQFIENIISDAKIEELINENRKIERE